MFSCKEPYKPSLNEINEHLLVVEGLINLGPEPTIIKLSRTASVVEKGNFFPELRAKISIEGNNNQTYNLVETTSGTYQSGILNLDPLQKYRLHIITKGNEYVTDFLEARVSPPIDSVGWTVKPEGLQIYVNTHDNMKKSRYYRWEFEETWIFHAPFYSLLVWENGGIRNRDDYYENIYKCWNSGASSKIVLGSSIKLTDDIIHKQPVILIPDDSEKLTEKYSILVKQYTLTKEAFDFWENLRKNTENLGSIFDVQPSQLTGNVRNVKNPKEPVLGYISIGNIQTKRIFVSATELPLNWKPKASSTCLSPDTIRIADAFKEFSTGIYVPISALTNDGGTYAYLVSSPQCTDCTLRGTKQKPAFWQ